MESGSIRISVDFQYRFTWICEVLFGIMGDMYGSTPRPFNLYIEIAISPRKKVFITNYTLALYICYIDQFVADAPKPLQYTSEEFRRKVMFGNSDQQQDEPTIIG